MDCWGREREMVFNTFLQVAHTDFFRFFFSLLDVVIFISFSLKMSNHELISAISASKWTYSWGHKYSWNLNFSRVRTSLYIDFLFSLDFFFLSCVKDFFSSLKFFFAVEIIFPSSSSSVSSSQNVTWFEIGTSKPNQLNLIICSFDLFRINPIVIRRVKWEKNIYSKHRMIYDHNIFFETSENLKIDNPKQTIKHMMMHWSINIT